MCNYYRLNFLARFFVEVLFFFDSTFLGRVVYRCVELGGAVIALRMV